MPFIIEGLAKALSAASSLYMQWRAGKQAFEAATDSAPGRKGISGLTEVRTDTPMSTCFEWIHYSPLTGRLVVRFRNRPRYPNYVFSKVPRLTWLGWLQNASYGSYYHRYVKRYSDVIRGRGSYK